MSAVATEERSANSGAETGGGATGAKVKEKPPNSDTDDNDDAAVKDSNASNAAIMLTTPKMESAGGISSLLSPRSFPTPRFTPSASGLSNGHMERHLAAASRAASGGEGPGGRGSGEGDMLTTPNFDSFPPSATGADFPLVKGSGEAAAAEGAESTPPPPEPQEPPRDLPLVSELGLRSPCDGLLAKRRRLFKDMKQVSSNSAGDRSDSNSCDTPTSSQNSPRDMTMKASNGEGTSPTSLTAPAAVSSISSGSSVSSSSSTSRVQVKLEFPDSSSSSSAPRSPTARSPFQSKAASMTTTDTAGFKHPSKGRPSAVAAVAAAAAANAPSQAHVTPSPLALVPSPNLSAIERNFGSALLKTPKLLDINVFDFIPERANLPPAPAASSSVAATSLSSSRSPGCERDQLPRSPRFSIPEAPTDLSNKSPAAGSTGSSASSNAASLQSAASMMADPPPYPSEAEDLSVNSSRSLKADASPSPPQAAAAAVTTTTLHAGQQPPGMQHQPQLLTLKQEYIDPAASRSRNVSGLAAELVKAEISDDYEPRYVPPPHVVAPPQPHHSHPSHHHHHHLHHQSLPVAAAGPFQVQGGGGSGGGGANPSSTMLRFQPAVTVATAAAAAQFGNQVYQRYIADHHPSSRPGSRASPVAPMDQQQYLPPPQYVAHALHPHWQQAAAAAQSQSWPSPQHDESSVSPPLHCTQTAAAAAAMAAVAAGQRPSANTTTAAAALLQATAIAQRRASLSPGPTAVASRAATPLQRPASSTPPLSTTAAGARKRKTPTKAATTPKAPKGSGKKKRPADAGGAGGGAGEGGGGGPRRVFTCEKCQRSYDWNYNLNRHRKYECGKENAFQCAKCGRKFPHKQNCVYHLKRKHKIVCDTIDQYVSSGLVLFRGQAGPAGQQTANPADAAQ